MAMQREAFAGSLGTGRVELVPGGSVGLGRVVGVKVARWVLGEPPFGQKPELARQSSSDR